VRSSLAAARYAGTIPDLTVLAAETDVDLVVSGATLRAGDQIRVTAQLLELLPTSPAPAMAGLLLVALGREDEAITSLEEDEAKGPNVAADFCRAVRFALQQRSDEARAIVQHYAASPIFVDPEGVFHMAQISTRLGDHDEAIAGLSRSVEHGYCGLPALEVDPWLDPLRGRNDFRRLLDRAEIQRRAALDTFIVAGGERLLGVAVR